MLWIHPILQVTVTLVAVYVLILAWPRFVTLHLGKKARFNWKRHVFWGQVAMFGWLAGLLGGLAVVRLNWSANLITGNHALIALALLPLIFWGLGTGLYMDRVKKPGRKILPLLHGLGNLLTLSLAFVQFDTGWDTITFLLLKQ